MAVKCGNCKTYHDTADAVRTCYQGAGFGPTTATIKAEGDVAKAEAPITEKQLGFLRTLLADRPMWANVMNYHDDIIVKFTKREASAVIGQAKEVEKEAAAKGADRVGPAELEDGIYRDNDGTYWKVYHTIHGRNVQVAKRLIITDNGDGTFNGTFEYVGKKPLYHLTPAMLLNQEEAKQFGLIYGFCVFGHDLTREESLHVGYGPGCAKKMGWWYPTKAELKRLKEATAPAN